jgi:hypothetical protein
MLSTTSFTPPIAAITCSVVSRRAVRVAQAIGAVNFDYLARLEVSGQLPVVC